MSDSLRDQLLKAGFAPKPRTESRPQPQRGSQRPPQGKPSAQGQKPAQHKQHPHPQQRRERSSGEMDLAKAYALRDKTEREQREREQREAEQRAKERKERKQKLATLLNGIALNDANADIPRHFPHQNKIRRIYVTAEQQPRLNGGELAVVQFAGRYLLVPRETGAAAQAIDTEALVLQCDPQAVDEDGIPADIIW